MLPLEAAPSQKAKVLWGPDCLTACAYLTSLIETAPRAMWKAESILDSNHCLALMSDASDDAISACLFWVRCPNATDVTEAMLKDRDVSQLLATKVKRLTASQQRWATWEAEFYAIVTAVKTWGNYLTTATSSYPKDPLGLNAKIVAFSDSTTSIAKWLTIHVPEGPVPCSHAKKRRFNEWATSTAHTDFWPMTIKFMPGTNISIAHMMTHMADMLESRIALAPQLPKMQYPIQIISTMYMFPARLVSYHTDAHVKDRRTYSIFNLHYRTDLYWDGGLHLVFIKIQRWISRMISSSSTLEFPSYILVRMRLSPIKLVGCESHSF